MWLLKDKRGDFELMQEETVELLVIILITVGLTIFVGSSVNGEISNMITKSKTSALFIDAALNSDKNIDTSITLEKNIDDSKFVIKIDEKLELKKKGAVISRSYRIVNNLNKVLLKEETENSVSINIKQNE